MTKSATLGNAKSWHFPVATLEFLRALKKNNTREWFAAHKGEYDAAYREASDVFSALMMAELQNLTGMAHAAKVFRIHRDMRFSRDKTPYNAHLHISFAPRLSGGAKPAFMFGLDPERISVGAGVFAFEPRAPEAYRAIVDGAGGDGLHEIMGRLENAGASFSEPELKRVPQGYDAGHKQADLLRRKGLCAWISHSDPKIACAPGLIAMLASDFKRLKPLMDWLLKV